MASNRIKTRYTGVYRYNAKTGTAFHVNYRYKGKLIWETVGWEHDGITVEDARDRRAELVKNARKQQRGINLTFSSAFENYLQIQRADNRNVTSDVSRYTNHLEKPFGDKRLSDITLWDVQAEKATWNLAESTKYQVIGLISNVYAKMIKYGKYSGKNPIRLLSRKSPNNRRVRFLTKSEATCFLKAVSERDRDAYYQVCLALFAGLRKCEVLRLKTADINFKDMTITVLGKGNKYRSIEMAVGLGKILYDLSEQDSSKPLFTVYKDKAIRKAIELCDLNPPGTVIKDSVSFHTLRHTFASWLVQQGTSLNTIKELMGHATIRMTERYAHLAPKHRESEVNKMVDGFLG